MRTKMSDSIDIIRIQNISDEWKTPQTVEDRNEIWERFLPMVWKIAGSYYSRNRGRYSLEDMFQEGAIALHDAIRLYRPERGVLFKTYAYTSVSRRIWRYNNMNNLIHVPEHCRYPEDMARAKGWCYLSDGDQDSNRYLQIESDLDEVDNMDLWSKVDLVKDELTPRERYICEKKYVEGVSFDSLAQELGISRQRVCQISQNMREYLRDRLSSVV